MIIAAWKKAYLFSCCSEGTRFQKLFSNFGITDSRKWPYVVAELKSFRPIVYAMRRKTRKCEKSTGLDCTGSVIVVCLSYHLFWFALEHVIFCDLAQRGPDHILPEPIRETKAQLLG